MFANKPRNDNNDRSKKRTFKSLTLRLKPSSEESVEDLLEERFLVACRRRSSRFWTPSEKGKEKKNEINLI